MNKSLIIVGFILYLFGCQSKTDTSNRIDYDKLNKIEIEPVLKIGESEKYIPGELGDLVLTSDGTMLVSDWGKTTIEQFSAEGEHVKTIAKEGRGPGELPSAYFLHKGKNDTLIVWHAGMSRRVDTFSKGTDKIYRFAGSRILKKNKNRFVTLIGARSSKGYYAKTRWNFEVLQQRFDNPRDYYWYTIVIVDSVDNILQDSLHMLKTPAPLVKRFATGGMLYIGRPPYQNQDHFRLMEQDRYLIARSDSSTLYFYDRNHTLDKRIPLQVKERPVKRADLDFAFELINVDSKVRRKMEARVPDVKPPFHNIWVSKHHIWLDTDINENGKQIVVLNMEGKPKGTFYLSVYDDIQCFRNNRIYALHKDPNSGHSIRVYQVNF